MCSKELAAFATSRGTLPLNARTSRLMFARTARARVSCKADGPLSTVLTACSLWEIGHKTMECTENRKFDLHDIPDKLPEEAWAILKKASDEKDLEDFRDVRNP